MYGHRFWNGKRIYQNEVVRISIVDVTPDLAHLGQLTVQCLEVSNTMEGHWWFQYGIVFWGNYNSLPMMHVKRNRIPALMICLILQCQDLPSPIHRID